MGKCNSEISESFLLLTLLAAHVFMTKGGCFSLLAFGPAKDYSIQCDSTFGCNCQSLVIYAVPQRRRSNFHQVPISMTRRCLSKSSVPGRPLPPWKSASTRSLCHSTCLPRAQIMSWLQLVTGRVAEYRPPKNRRRTSELRSFLPSLAFLWKSVRT